MVKTAMGGGGQFRLREPKTITGPKRGPKRLRDQKTDRKRLRDHKTITGPKKRLPKRSVIVLWLRCVFCPRKRPWGDDGVSRYSQI